MTTPRSRRSARGSSSSKAPCPGRSSTPTRPSSRPPARDVAALQAQIDAQDRPRAVRRPARHPRRQPRPVPEPGDAGHRARVVDARVRRLHAAAAAARPPSPSGCRCGSSASGGDAAAAIDGTIARDRSDASTPRRATSSSRASVPNPDRAAAPGHVRRASRSCCPSEASVVTVPATAVVHAPYGDSVFVVEAKPPDAPGMRTTPDGKPVKVARQQFVRLGEARGDFVAITEGVKAGQEVVTRRARSSCATARRSSSTTRSKPDAAARSRTREPLSHEAHRHLHPPPGARDRRQPRDPHRRAPGDPHAQRAPVPEARERDGHGPHGLRRARTPTSCAASSPRRSSASIAAADGIDYIESQSVQGLSTINVRLKLNFNAADALADISARVDQVRADLPPEAEVPAINIEPSDARSRRCT